MAIIMMLLVGSAQAQEYNLVYSYGSNRLEYKVDAKGIDEAISLGADVCFDVLSQRLSLEQKYDLIDACANPGFLSEAHKHRPTSLQ